MDEEIGTHLPDRDESHAPVPRQIGTDVGERRTTPVSGQIGTQPGRPQRSPYGDDGQHYSRGRVPGDNGQLTRHEEAAQVEQRSGGEMNESIGPVPRDAPYSTERPVRLPR